MITQKKLEEMEEKFTMTLTTNQICRINRSMTSTHRRDRSIFEEFLNMREEKQ